jgi:FkbM family methyltransferase
MLVFDIGMFDGSDTAYYLERGHNVVAVEANPGLCSVAQARFAKKIEAGRLKIVNAAITGGARKVSLTVTADGATSSIYFDHLNLETQLPVSTCDVDTVTLPELIALHGQPDFIKVDIEGADRECVMSLRPDICPQYLSFEAHTDQIELVRFVAGLGYAGFKLISQCSFIALENEHRWRHRLARKMIFLAGYESPRFRRIRGRLFAVECTSGPPPWESDGGWHSAEELIGLWSDARDRKLISGWYDVHAVKETGS